jgi:hypothetical protein
VNEGQGRKATEGRGIEWKGREGTKWRKEAKEGS